MELNHFESIEDTAVLQSKLTSVSTAIVYYFGYERNSWHGTWVYRYFENGVFYTDIESAKREAEHRRVQGSKFSIIQIPCLVLSSNLGAIIYITFQENFDNLRAMNLVEKWYNTETYKVFLNPAIRFGMSLADISNLLPQYRVNRIGKAFGYKGDKKDLIPLNSNLRLKKWLSTSYGSQYSLSWYDAVNEFSYKTRSLFQIRDTILALNKKPTDALLHYVNLNGPITKGNTSNKEYKDIEIFLRQKYLPNHVNIWQEGLNNDKEAWSRLKTILEDQGFKLLNKKIGYALASPQWWKPNTPRVLFPPIFGIGLNEDDQNTFEPIKTLVECLAFMTSYCSKNNCKDIVWSFYDGSLRVMNFKMNINIVMRIQKELKDWEWKIVDAVMKKVKSEFESPLYPDYTDVWHLDGTFFPYFNSGPRMKTLKHINFEE